MNKRNFVLNNIKNVLKTFPQISIKNIQVNRPHPALLDNVPMICIYSGDEDVNPRGHGGNEYIVDTYFNDFTIKIDVLINNKLGADEELNEHCGEIEDALNNDIFFEKITGCKQGDQNGLQIRGSKPYTFDDGAENTYAASSTIIAVQYITDAIPDIRLSELEGIDGEIKTTAHTEETKEFNLEINTNQ